MIMKKIIFFAVLFVTGFIQSKAQLLSAVKTNFDLSTSCIIVDENDFPLVKKAAALLQQDIEAVTGKKIPIQYSLNRSAKNNIIIGSITNSSIIKVIADKN